MTSSDVIWARSALTENGWQSDVTVEIDDSGRITSVTPGTAPRHPGNRILLPAAANLHSHGFQRAMAGLSEYRTSSKRDSFWTWRELMYRFLAKLTPDDVESITAFAQVEMLEAGFASVAEFHYLHNGVGGTAYADRAELSNRIIMAARSTGIGLTLLPVFYERGGGDGRPLAGNQLRFANTLDSYLRLVELVQASLEQLCADAKVGVAPHSLRAVDPQSLSRLVAFLPGAPHHMHIAEQAGEVDEIVSALGARPVRWLLHNHDIDESWCLVHCTHMEPDESAALAASGAVAGLCPVTEANLGDGMFGAVRFSAHGGRFGVGSDSNIRISLAEELRLLEYGQRLKWQSRAVLADPIRSTGRVLYDAATRNGAAALGRDAGVIRPGLLADLVACDADAVDLAGRRGDAVLDAFIFACRDRPISDVWSAGRHVVSDGRHIHRQTIEANYRRAITKLMERI